MSIAPKPENVVPYTHMASSRPCRQRPRLVALPSPVSAENSAPVLLPVQRRCPIWLRVLLLGQWVSGTVALITVTGAVGMYALTVNVNRQLALAATTLEHNQTQQQQLTSANAVFQNHLARTAVTILGENRLHPRDVIFLEQTPTSDSPAASDTDAARDDAGPGHFEPAPDTPAAKFPTRPPSIFSQPHIYPQGY